MSCPVSMQWRGHGVGTAVHRECGHTWCLHRQAIVTVVPLVPLTTCCGPWQAGGGLPSADAGNLHVLFGIHGVVGSGAGTA